jgi:hypothetical protein
VNTSDAYRNIRWLHLRCGQRVHRLDDPRHEGTIRSIHNSVVVWVKWDNDWLSSEHANDLVSSDD